MGFADCCNVVGTLKLLIQLRQWLGQGGTGLWRPHLSFIKGFLVGGSDDGWFSGIAAVGGR